MQVHILGIRCSGNAIGCRIRYYVENNIAFANIKVYLFFNRKCRTVSATAAAFFGTIWYDDLVNDL